MKQMDELDGIGDRYGGRCRATWVKDLSIASQGRFYLYCVARGLLCRESFDTEVRSVFDLIYQAGLAAGKRGLDDTQG